MNKGIHARRLGWETIPAQVVEVDRRGARLREIAENLHRNELTALERSTLVAEWCELIGQSAQLEQIESKREDGRGHRPEGGDAKAARELNLSRGEVQRSKKVASLSPEAREAARPACRVLRPRSRPTKEYRP